MQDRDRFFDTVLRDEIRRLNSHLPRDRKTLKELLEQEEPSVPSVGGESIRMKKNELELLSSLLPDSAKERVRLPLVLLRQQDLGRGAFTLLGDPYEEYSLMLLADAFKGTFEGFRKQKQNPVVFYKPQISDLLRRFHSLIVIGFGISEFRKSDRPRCVLLTSVQDVVPRFHMRVSTLI